VGRRLARKPWLPVGLLLRVAGVLLVAAAFYAGYVYEGAGWPVGQIAAFAAFGIACQLLGWNRLVLLIAMALGPLLEDNIRRALLISRGDPAIFLRWPISGTVLLLAAAILTLAIVLSAVRSLPRRRPAQGKIGKLNLATTCPRMENWAAPMSHMGHERRLRQRSMSASAPIPDHCPSSAKRQQRKVGWKEAAN